MRGASDDEPDDSRRLATELAELRGQVTPDKTFTPDKATGVLSDFATQTNGAFLPNFPYLGTPNCGFGTQPKNHNTCDGASGGGTGSGAVPAGGAATGAGGTSASRDTELLVGGALAAAGAVAAAGAYQHNHTTTTTTTDRVPTHRSTE